MNTDEPWQRCTIVWTSCTDFPELYPEGPPTSMLQLSKAQRRVLRMLSTRPYFTVDREDRDTQRIAGVTAQALVHRGLVDMQTPGGRWPAPARFVINPIGHALLLKELL